jgi:hypothetical protein
MREIMHYPLRGQVEKINQVLRGHYAYYGVGGNFKSLSRIYRYAERYWHKMLSNLVHKFANVFLCYAASRYGSAHGFLFLT